MHHWKDKNVDWSGLYDAAYYIATYLGRYGRIHVMDYKEKWGEVRVYILWGMEDRWIPYSRLNPILIPYQKWIYRRAYANAIRKWPHLRNEILNGADWQELLEGL